jgi:threonine/homoserine/homoserine lactone efflux protein
VTAFLAFFGVSALVIVTPGPDTALTIGASLGGSRRAGVFTALGVSTGQAVWTLCASAGLTALLLASEPAFLALKLAGGAYLVVLGAKALLRACRRSEPPESHARAVSAAGAYRRGLLSNLGNPKMAVFFTSLLPEFAPRPLSFLALASMGLVFCTMTLVWLTAYAVLVDRLAKLLRRNRVRRTLDAMTGAVLIAAGLRLATER